MTLLFDQNLSPQLALKLADLFPNSDHVYPLNLDLAQDHEVFEYARREGFTLVTKDADFGELNVLRGFPPKVIWIRRGNCSTARIEEILRRHYNDIVTLESDSAKGVLTLSKMIAGSIAHNRLRATIKKSGNDRPPQPATAALVTGIWKVIERCSWATGTMTFQLIQNSSGQLSGSGSASWGTSQIESGQIAGNKISWVTNDRNDFIFSNRVSYEGTIDSSGATMRGTYTQINSRGTCTWVRDKRCNRAGLGSDWIGARLALATNPNPTKNFGFKQLV
jgi:predicted nuclease of predicted toxin-antitoxin system